MSAPRRGSMLWRRVGDTEQARDWFDRIPEKIIGLVSQHWALAAAEQQRTDPQEWFG
jgi:hypothetical protein